MEFSAEERAFLLRIAHQSIESAAQGRGFTMDPPSPHLAELRGVFTTVYLDKELRGCVGYPLAIAALYRAVAETAKAAAFEDLRFPPLQTDEIPRLEISLSVLSPLSPIRPEEVEIGRHGLVISQGNHRGLLLPQVPVEHGWDRITFLEQTCKKAGLPKDAWQHGAAIEAFTAEVFGDGE
ncbi:MAG TPA: AmmeMemoRadiSam system protein A [Terriglobales bacterium]|nr:AmmeMemoRadiSam system protein A [Terriglobales bacterium]